jgi:hypothetical protein
MPHDSVVQMCASADLIVEGTADQAGDGFTISAVHDDPSGKLKPGDRITVAHLSSHSRSPNHPFATVRLAETTRQAVLFLVSEKVAGQYKPISCYTDPEKGGGSRGLLWWNEEKCFGYAQIMNPGPYVLTDGESSHRTPDIKALRAGIEMGLETAALCRKLQAIEDPAKKARAIANAWQAGGPIRSILSLRIELRKIGQPAVPPLINLLKTEPRDAQLNDVMLTLYDIGRADSKAISETTELLIDRFKDPGPTARYYILSALTSTRDPKAIPAIRPTLAQKEAYGMQVRVQAAVALVAMDDQASFEPIDLLLDEVIAMPRGPNGNHGFSETVDLLNALNQLDPQRAKASIDRIRKTPGLSNAVSHIR